MAMARSALYASGSKDMVNAVAAILGIVGLFAIVGACDRAEPSPGGSQEHDTGWRDPLQPNITWRLQSIDGNPIIEGTSITLSMYEGSIVGDDGCNGYGYHPEPGFVPIFTDSEREFAEGKFSARNPTTTLQLCIGIPGLMKQVDAYYEALHRGTTFRIQGNRLEILDGVKREALVFSRQPPLPGHQPNLAGTQWRLPGSSGVALAFLDDRVAIVKDECVRGLRTYRTSDRTLTFQLSLGLGRSRTCPENEAVSSLRRAEQYSVIDQSGSEVLMVGTGSGETLKLVALPAIGQDVEQREWRLTNIVDLRPDGPRNSTEMKGEVGPRLVFTLSFKGSSAGCNFYEASLTHTGATFSIRVPSVSGETCDHPDNDEDVMQRKPGYRYLLPRVTRIGTYEEGLFMSTGTGIYLLFEAQ